MIFILGKITRSALAKKKNGWYCLYKVYEIYCVGNMT